MAVRGQSSHGSMGHIATGCKGHRGRERERKRHTHTQKRKSRRAKTNAYRLSALVSAAPSLTVTTLSDTHRGWGVSRGEEVWCMWVCFWGAVNFLGEERNNKSCGCGTGFEPIWPNRGDYTCRGLQAWPWKFHKKSNINSGTYHFPVVPGRGHNLNLKVSGFKWKKSLKSLNIDISVNQCLIDWRTQVASGRQVCVGPLEALHAAIFIVILPGG